MISVIKNKVQNLFQKVVSSSYDQLINLKEVIKTKKKKKETYMRYVLIRGKKEDED